MGRLRTPAREGAPAARRSRPRMAEAGSRQWHPCKPRSIWRAACPGSCQSCFCGLWFAEPARQVAVGAAWASSPDRDRFESIYARALKAAGELDPVVCRAFDQFAKYSWKEPPPSHADECVLGVLLRGVRPERGWLGRDRLRSELSSGGLAAERRPHQRVQDLLRCRFQSGRPDGCTPAENRPVRFPRTDHPDSFTKGGRGWDPVCVRHGCTWPPHQACLVRAGRRLC